MVFKTILIMRERRKIRKRIGMGIVMLVTILTVSRQEASGQIVGISTNILGYAKFVTMNLEVGAAVARNWTFSIDGSYNPFVFNRNDADTRMQYKHLTIGTGVKYWPFYLFSGFNFGVKTQWSEYNIGGIISPRTVEGDAFGIAFSGGYSLIISKHFNIDFSLGVWGGYTFFTRYSCPSCGEILQKDSRWFIAPTDIKISLTFNI